MISSCSSSWLVSGACDCVLISDAMLFMEFLVARWAPVGWSGGYVKVAVIFCPDLEFSYTNHPRTVLDIKILIYWRSKSLLELVIGTFRAGLLPQISEVHLIKDRQGHLGLRDRQAESCFYVIGVWFQHLSFTMVVPSLCCSAAYHPRRNGDVSCLVATMDSSAIIHHLILPPVCTGTLLLHPLSSPFTCYCSACFPSLSLRV